MAEMIDAVMKLFGQGLPCLFHLLTGLYCPGCGGTRATRFLLHLEIGKSLLYHPLVPYLAFVALLEVGSWLASKLWKRPGLYVRRYELFTYIGVGIILVNWGLKNYMLVVKGIDLLP